jgi:hypothetical protein
VVDHEAGCRAKTRRAEVGAVAVACGDQQVGALGGLDDHALDPTAAGLLPGLASQTGLGVGE